MVDKLITSYRAKIYDWSFGDLKNLFSKSLSEISIGLHN